MKYRSSSLFIIGILCLIPVFFLSFPNVTHAAWYDNSWVYRTQITIDHTKVASSTATLNTNFPILISTTTTALKHSSYSGGHVGKANGGDILFTSSDGTTALNYEIESYASSTGALIAWVKIPSLATSTDTSIYMYYGNAAATDPIASVATGVWNDGGSNYFKGVYHLLDGTSLSTTSSTGSNNATNVNTTAATTGKIDGGASLASASSNYLSLPAADFGSYPTSGNTNTYVLTFETWFKTSSTGVILGQSNSVTPPSNATGYVPAIYIDSNGKIRASAFWHNAVTNQILTSSSYNDGLWHHLVNVYNNGVETLFIDGSSVGTQNMAEYGYANPYVYFLGTGYSNNWPLTNNGWFYFNGTIDETRISTTARSADWIKTEYNNQNSPSTFSTSATEEVLAAPDAPTGLTLTASSTQVVLTWTAPVNGGTTAIDDYVVDYKLTSTSTWSTFADGTSVLTTATVTGLTAGASYDFRVSAHNSIGQGAASATSTVTTPIVYYWVGGATNTNTNNVANWSTTVGSCANSANATLPTSTDEVHFVSNCNNAAVVNANFSVSRFYIDTGHSQSVTLSSATLTASSILQVSAGTLALGANNLTAGAVTLVAGTISGTTGVLTATSYAVQSGTISAILAGTGTTMTKSTSGAVTLSAVNTFSGNLTILAGTISGASSAASPYGAGSVVLGDASGGANDAKLAWSGANALTIANPIILASTTTGVLTIENSINLTTTFSGGITGSNSLVIKNQSTGRGLTFSTGTINNTGTVTNAGTGSGPVSITSIIGTNVTGVIQNSSTSAFSLTNNNTFSGSLTANAGSVSLSGSNSFTGGITITGGATVSLSAANTFPGNIVVKSGTVYGTNSASAFGAGSITLGDSAGGTNSATLSIGGDVSGTITNPLILASTTTGTLTFTDGNSLLGFAGGITGSNSLVVDNTGSTRGLTFSSGAINNTGTITHIASSGTGAFSITANIGSNVTGLIQNSATSQMILSGSNSFSSMTIKSGAVTGQTNANAFGSGTITIGDSTGGSNAASLYANSITVTNPVVLASTTSGTLSIGGTTPTYSGGVTGTNNLVLNNTSGVQTFSTGAINNTGTITNSGAGGSVTVNSVIGPNVTGLTQNSAAAAMTLAGNNSSVNGSVTITAGTLALSGTTALSVAGNWSKTGTFTANSSTVTFTNGTHLITGANTFYNLTAATSSTLTFPASVTQTIGNTFSCVGTAANPITINSSSVGTQATLSKASGTVSCDYLLLTDSAATGGATWNAGSNSISYSNNTGWSGGMTVPSAPTISTATSNNGQVTLSWSAPSNGGSAITDYVVEYKLHSEPTVWSIFSDGVSVGTTAVVTGLTNGLSYDFRLSAVNVVGQSSASATSSATPASVPDAPTIGTATAGNAQATVTFTALTVATSTAWYNSAWGYRAKVTVNSGQATTTQTNFPVYVNLANLPAGFWSHVKSDGGDIRVTNSAGTELAREVVMINTGANTGELWFKGDSVYSGASFNIYYGNAATSDYASTTTYGSQKVWDDGGSNYYKAVWHMPNGTSLTSNDSTSNASNGILSGATIPSATTGKIDGGGSFNGSSGYLRVPHSTLFNAQSNPFTVSVWVNNQIVDTNTWRSVIEKNREDGGGSSNVWGMWRSASNKWTFRVGSGGVDSATTAQTNTWTFLVLSWNGSTFTGYVNGVSAITPTAASPTNNTHDVLIGDSSATEFFKGIIDEVKIADTVRSATWIATEYNNQSSPTSFYTAATQETFSNTPTNGGSVITAYTITSNPGSVSTTTASTTAVVTGLTNGTAYTFTVSATNAVGTGTSSAPSNSVIPATVPDAPTAVSATPGNGQVALTWSAPVYNGGAAISDYVIEDKLNASSTWDIFSEGTSVATSSTVTGLVNGSLYNFRVSAANIAGQGTSSSVINSTPFTTSNAPTSVVATRGNTQATVTFVAPVFNGGSTITGYTITSNPGSISTTTASTTAVVTGLTNGIAYTFTVTATNAAGIGAVSVASNSITPATVPDAPTSPAATAGNAQSSVSFTPPVSNGGSAVTSYTVTSSPGSATSTGSASPIVVTGLNNGTAYTFSVTANNDVGTSSASVASNSVTPVTVPDAPTIGTAARGNAQASVAFTPPISNGGTAITSYFAVSSPGGFTGSGNISPINVAGLTNGTAYTFAVSAINAVGTSTASADSNSVTPATVPDAPTGLAPTAGNAQVSLSWVAPIVNGGSAIIDYTIQYKLTSEPTVWSTFAHVASIVTTMPVSGVGLVNGTSYDFRVSAVNDVGQGTPSALATAVPVTVPEAPTGVSATAGNAQATIAFTAPAINGGSPVTSYIITSSPGNISTTTETTSGIVTGLTNGTSYTFAVTATNAIGVGAVSSSSNAVIPVTIPDAPTAVSASEGNRQATVSFTAPASNGGSTILDYTITSSPGNISTTTTTTSGVVTGLTNGTTYTFTVVARNAVGTSSVSGISNSVRLSTEPGSPVNLAASVQGSSINLSWSAPTSNGGSAVTDYIIEYQLTTGGTWSVFADAESVNTTATVNGLSDGTSYDFRVSAKNIIGPGLPSNTVTASPGEPAQVLIQGFPDLTNPSIGAQVLITNEGTIQYEYHYTWCVTDSENNLCGGGDDIFSNTASKLLQSHENWNPTLISTVPNPGNYWFHLRVDYGSQSSPADQPFTAVATYPDAPTSVTATSSNAQATVSFVPPVSNGGSVITGYTVTSSPGGLTGVGGTSPIVVTGLTNGVSYTFTVTATNGMGTGPASVASNSVVPVTVPDAPTGVTAVAGNTQVALSWSAPNATGGLPITDYIIEYKISSDSDWLVFADGVSAGTTATITGLTNNVTYDFRISTVTHFGRSTVNSTSATLGGNNNQPSGGSKSRGGGGSGYVQNVNEPVVVPTETPVVPVVAPVTTPVSPTPTPSNPVQKGGQTQPVVQTNVSQNVNKNETKATPVEHPVVINTPVVSTSTKGGTFGGIALWLVLSAGGGFALGGLFVFLLRRRLLK